MDTLSHSKENVNAISKKSVQAPSPQLALPTGPIALLRGGRLDRTEEDRDFLSEAFKVKAGGASATALYRCLAYYASLTERRIAYPSQSTMATYCDMSVRQVRRVLSKLQNDGLITCLNRKQGACSSTYELSRRGQYVPFKWDILSPNKEREGKNKRTKALSLSADVQAQDHGETDEDKEVNLSLFPSLSQEQEKASAPVTENRYEIQTNTTQVVAQAVCHAFPKVVALWCALRRKLDLEVNHTMETEFDKLPHRDKVRIINYLEAQERELVHQGRLAPPPITKPKSIGYLPTKAVAAADEALHRATCQHVPAADLPINCEKCGAYIGDSNGGGFGPALPGKSATPRPLRRRSSEGSGARGPKARAPALSVAPRRGVAGGPVTTPNPA